MRFLEELLRQYECKEGELYEKYGSLIVEGKGNGELEKIYFKSLREMVFKLI